MPGVVWLLKDDSSSSSRSGAASDGWSRGVVEQPGPSGADQLLQPRLNRLALTCTGWQVERAASLAPRTADLAAHALRERKTLRAFG